MFSLIQRGQLYIDGNGYPVQVHHCSASHVVYRRQDNQTRSVDIGKFNSTFERLDYQEYRQIRAEQAQTEHIKNLREQIRRNKERQRE
ncbi:DUF4222 domain-containing protein [Salmonella enterica]|nr:DUF4222 domain-containing protein [Salmonella enterica subsp. enterica serovar Sandiego]EEK2577418.1 DUF4222 domain-containing protein [Salmonella enterica subsp. enterica serovar Montevideo]EEP1512077.1 DUF4222 domain-containing protein [Salmonella enterica]